MSQLLSRLEAQLAQATDPTARAELTARISCLHSRVGRFAPAQQLITGLRREFGDGHDPRASVWIMMAEGLNLYYDRQFTQALDRLSRAQFLAVSMRYAPFVGIVSAWKALVEYGESRYDAMAGSLKLALDHVAPDDLDTLTRVCLTVAISFRFLGDRDQARLWFLRGHHYAVKNGDQAAIEALLHNSAVGAVDFLRLRHAAGQTDAEAIRRARFELESAKNLNTLTQARSLLEHLHRQDARLKMIEGRFVSAIESIRIAASHASSNGARRPPSIAVLEMDYCEYRRGEDTGIDAFFDTLATLPYAELELDDRIAIASMASELSRAAGRTDDAASHARQLADLLAEHQAEADRLYTALRQVTSHWTPDIAPQAQDNIGDYY